MHQEAHTELAIHDLQRRLTLLGYRLGDEADKGLFGEKTAAAVASFKENTGLGYDDVLDQTTWTALKDASMQIGDRLLYLHMPHFRGRDVGELQGALSSMGFACTPDDNFGPETEQALRDFQSNMGLDSTGLLDNESLAAILRLRHLWDGKRGFFVEGRTLTTARSVDLLKTVSVCVFGIDAGTRAIANRIANLARATTVESGIVSASALATEPSRDMLLIGLEQGEISSHERPQGTPEIPVVSLNAAADTKPNIREALRSARNNQNRLTLVIDSKAHEGEDALVYSQELATYILDLLCEALEALPFYPRQDGK